MGGFFGVAAKSNCTLDLFYGVDYHSHLGTPVSYTHLDVYKRQLYRLPLTLSVTFTF